MGSRRRTCKVARVGIPLAVIFHPVRFALKTERKRELYRLRWHRVNNAPDPRDMAMILRCGTVASFFVAIRKSWTGSSSFAGSSIRTSKSSNTRSSESHGNVSFSSTIGTISLPAGGQQMYSTPRNADMPHQSAVMMELFNTIDFLEQSSDAYCCHFSARRHSPV